MSGALEVFLQKDLDPDLELDLVEISASLAEIPQSLEFPLRKSLNG